VARADSISRCTANRTLASCTGVPRKLPVDCKPFTVDRIWGYLRLPLPLNYFEVQATDTQTNNRILFADSYPRDIGTTGLTQLYQVCTPQHSIVVTEAGTANYEHPWLGTMFVGPIEGDPVTRFDSGDERVIFDNWGHTDTHPLYGTPGNYTVATSQQKLIKYASTSYACPAGYVGCTDVTFTEPPSPFCLPGQTCEENGQRPDCCAPQNTPFILIPGVNDGVGVCAQCIAGHPCSQQLPCTEVNCWTPEGGLELCNCVWSEYYTCFRDDNPLGNNQRCFNTSYGYVPSYGTTTVPLSQHMAYSHVAHAIVRRRNCFFDEYYNVGGPYPDFFNYNIQTIGAFVVVIVLAGHLTSVTAASLEAADGVAYIVSGGAGLSWSGWVYGWAGYLGTGALTLDTNLGIYPILDKAGLYFSRVFPFINEDVRVFQNECINGIGNVPRFEHGFEPFGENVPVTLLTLYTL
jgi:hypothetical protein